MAGQRLHPQDQSTHLRPFEFLLSGPTADGRRRPDLVAPGERIVSARHHLAENGPDAPTVIDDLFVEQSGTSPAAPHVSGMLAVFSAMRRKLIGYPEEVERILLQSCIDLNRDRDIQGAALPSPIKILALY